MKKGSKHSLESIEKMREAKKCKPLTEEHKEKIREARKKFWLNNPNERKRLSRIVRDRMNEIYKIYKLTKDEQGDEQQDK